jgi:hypothetical protein
VSAFLEREVPLACFKLSAFHLTNLLLLSGSYASDRGMK